MEMRIVVPDAASAAVLADRLTIAFGARRVRGDVAWRALVQDRSVGSGRDVAMNAQG
jgi:hypothetical protein